MNSLLFVTIIDAHDSATATNHCDALLRPSSTFHRKTTTVPTSFKMTPHHDLNNLLAPHLDALSTASASLLTPLTSVLTTLIAEVVTLRSAHLQLEARVSSIDARIPIPLPNTIPSLPNSPSSKSIIVDPELTQPPSPLLQQTPNQDNSIGSLSPYLQSHPPQQESEVHTPKRLKQTPVDSGNNSFPLKRRRRSSKRPSSGSSTLSVKQERREQPTTVISSQEKGTCKNEQNESPNSSTTHAPSLPDIAANADKCCDTPKNEPKLKILKENNQKEMVLPTTPTTEAKPKKRKSNLLSNEPTIEGFSNAAVAVRTVEDIAARREAENCPPNFRPKQKPLSERTCEPCQNSFRAQAAATHDPDVTFQRLLRSGCRHKEQLPRPSTPTGYWDLDFAETPTQPP